MEWINIFLNIFQKIYTLSNEFSFEWLHWVASLFWPLEFMLFLPKEYWNKSLLNLLYSIVVIALFYLCNNPCWQNSLV